jgi:hypothetical protein
MQPSRLETALSSGLARGGDLIQELATLRDYPIRSSQDAHAICLALARLIESPPETPDLPVPSRTALNWLAGLFQQVETEQAFAVLAEYGIPQLLRLFDERSDRIDLLFLLKLFALYRDPRGTDRIIRAAREGLQPEGRLWSVIFRQFDFEHPHVHRLLDALRDPLPGGFIAVAYLDWCNTLALAEKIQKHPFDTPEGLKLLLAYLNDQSATRHSYAQSAAACLPFLQSPLRQDLLALALDHPSSDVQMEAAWASAKLGSSAGVNFLHRLCVDPARSKQAMQYLRELDLEEAIPPQALDPEFMARAELVAWLAHPQEFGRPPDEITLLDSRELYWPPTRDRRRLWLLGYRFDVDPTTAADAKSHAAYEIGVGLVGSITFSLLGETRPDMTPEDIYALHCCWELEYRDDPRAPPERSIQAGRLILARHQPGFDV